MSTGTAGAQTPPARLDAAAAAGRAGEAATVCGQVAMTYCNTDRGLRLTLLTPAGTPPVFTLTDPAALTVEPGGPPVMPFGAKASEPCDVPAASMPRVTHEEKADYPKKLRGRGISGQVALQAVVEANGRVGDIRVTRTLDPDLDAEAIRR